MTRSSDGVGPQTARSTPSTMECTPPVSKILSSMKPRQRGNDFKNGRAVCIVRLIGLHRTTISSCACAASSGSDARYFASASACLVPSSERAGSSTLRFSNASFVSSFDLPTTARSSRAATLFWLCAWRMSSTFIDCASGMKLSDTTPSACTVGPSGAEPPTDPRLQRPRRGGAPHERSISSVCLSRARTHSLTEEPPSQSLES